MVITFETREGTDYFLEFSSDLGSWTTLPGGPANTGRVTIPATPSPRFFRLRTVR
jgi:hypothetical protein